ncbi:GNAT family N-acetyltransferase [Actinoplanes sp. NPDC051851]|uniref:GNAT family N-acetyltransferase n=1 Tax=Actinoplanes sp. NPDC051851 TaxID=3154753 RepID=UPI00344690EA
MGIVATVRAYRRPGRHRLDLAPGARIPASPSPAPLSLTPRSRQDDLYEVYASNPEYWRFSGDLDPDDITRPLVSGMLDDLGPDEEALVARAEDGRIVGYAEILHHHPVDGHPWIGLLLIDGRHHRKGYGRMIATQLENRFRMAGRSTLYLGVLTNNLKAQQFWTALGYRRVDLRPDRAKARPTLVLAKQLLPPG